MEGKVTGKEALTGNSHVQREKTAWNPPGQKTEISQLKKIQPDKGGKLQKWSKKVETITPNMDFKWWSVSSICFSILWVIPCPRGQSRGTGRGGRSCPCHHAGVPVPPLLLALPCCTLTAAPAERLLSNSLSLSVFVEAFHKPHQCFRELSLGLHGLGAGNDWGTGWNGSDPTCRGVGADPRWVGREK